MQQVSPVKVMHKPVFWHAVLNYTCMEMNEEPVPEFSAGTAAVNDDAVVIPVIKEELVVTTRTVVKGGVRIEKNVREETVVLDTPFVEEEIEITTVPVNRFTDTMPEPVRYEGDTMIIPVLKEVQVVRIMIEKEIHITKKKTKSTVPQSVVLRQEEVTVHNINHPE